LRTGKLEEKSKSNQNRIVIIIPLLTILFGRPERGVAGITIKAFITAGTLGTYTVYPILYRARRIIALRRSEYHYIITSSMDVHDIIIQLKMRR